MLSPLIAKVKTFNFKLLLRYNINFLGYIEECHQEDYVAFLKALSPPELVSKCSLLLPNFNHQDVSYIMNI